MATLREVQPN